MNFVCGIKRLYLSVLYNIWTASSQNQTQSVDLNHFKMFRSHPALSDDIFLQRAHKESIIKPLDSTGENCNQHDRNENESAWFSLALAADRDGRLRLWCVWCRVSTGTGSQMQLKFQSCHADMWKEGNRWWEEQRGKSEERERMLL
jgi:hypothetical protein